MHRPEELLDIHAAHVGGFLTQTEKIGLLGGNSLPLGQVCSVGVTGPGKVGQVIHHLSAEGGVLLSEGPPAVSQRAEPVPQVAGMPGTTVITGELAVEEPAVAVGVPGAPVLSHLVEVGRNDILAGKADEVRDMVLFVGSQRLRAGLDLETAIILIGPEGDFSPEEIKLAQENGFEPISLGESRLRTETAALVACHTIHVLNQ